MTCSKDGQFKILFTSVGRRVELVQAFKKAAEKLEVDLVIYGTDISESAPALFFCDKKEFVCKIDNVEYIPQLIEICKREHIHALIPTIDTDLLLLSHVKKQFKDIGTKVLVSAEEMIKVCRDKRYTADFFIHCGLKSPIPVDDYKKYTGDYPCFIKPKDGSSSVNAFKVNSTEELVLYAHQIKDYIIQPFIDGIEFTVDIFCDFDGNPIYITPRERMAIRSGEVIKTKIIQDEIINEECKRIIADFKPCGAITVQLIKQKITGNNYYIEINPRFGGGAPLSIKAGADSAEAIICLLRGEKLDYRKNATADGLTYSRFDQSICVQEANSRVQNIKAVIFDLDDTLYSEKEYVRSGYKAIAMILPQVENAEQKLWDAFIAGRPAIDAVLADEGIYSDILKDQCLATYRNHTPDIHLYAHIHEMLMSLKEAGIKTGIITDGRPNGQRLKLHALGLDTIVNEIIITDELGGPQFRKPNDIAFRIMQGRLGVPFENMIYVGDNPRKDFIAPKLLNMHSICIENDDGIYGKANGGITDFVSLILKITHVQ